ncbi:MAG TPA: lysylphosphatidylglycerol synthase transmembrane domain-containing protein [Pseudonocardiaceae bacterium]|nr:lysylphosphatidylglycerol synthase transmembrane domain-containing protein [Pseudonocardiaceae bacterium]
MAVVSSLRRLSGQRRWRRAALVIVGLAAVALATRVLYDSSDELFTAADTLTSVQPAWVLVAVLVELVSYLARGGATTVVLRHAGGGVGPIVLTAATLAGDAAAYCLPFGFAASGVVMMGVLRRRQVSSVVAGWMFAVSSVFYVGAVTVLTIIAVPVAGDDDPVPGLQSISIGLLGALAVLAVAYVLLRRPAVQRGLSRVLPTLRRAPAGRPPPSRAESSKLSTGLRDWARQLRTVRLTPAAGTAAFVLMLVSWITDVAVLAIAFLALGTSPPWTGLLLAYCAGQIAASVPITPGGIGVVEGSITLALVAFGGAEVITLAAVLLYRLIAYWGCIPAGGLAWLALRTTSRAPARQVAEVPEEPVKTVVAEAESAS